MELGINISRDEVLSDKKGLYICLLHYELHLVLFQGSIKAIDANVYVYDHVQFTRSITTRIYDCI